MKAVYIVNNPVISFHIGPKRIGKPFFTPVKPLTEKQWKTVQKFQKELDTEYDLRRKMLITRLDVTVQSFQVFLFIFYSCCFLF